MVQHFLLSFKDINELLFIFICAFFLQGVELSALSAAVSHFLNCFLSSFPDAVAHLPPDELVSRRKNRKRRNRVPGGGDNTAWASLTPSELWKNIASEAQSYYHFTLQW